MAEEAIQETQQDTGLLDGLANEVVEEGIAVVKDTENTFAVNTITKEYKVNAITQ